jgi:hypothetical protein
VNRKSLLKKYDLLLGIPNRKCNPHIRKLKSHIVICWEPLHVLRKRLQEAWEAPKEKS